MKIGGQEIDEDQHTTRYRAIATHLNHSKVMYSNTVGHENVAAIYGVMRTPLRERLETLLVRTFSFQIMQPIMGMFLAASTTDVQANLSLNKGEYLNFKPHNLICFTLNILFVQQATIGVVTT